MESKVAKFVSVRFKAQSGLQLRIVLANVTLLMWQLQLITARPCGRWCAFKYTGEVCLHWKAG